MIGPKRDRQEVEIRWCSAGFTTRTSRIGSDKSEHKESFAPLVKSFGRVKEAMVTCHYSRG